MSKNINVNPDHYKVAGRERQGEDILHQKHKQAMANNREGLTRGGRSARGATPKKRSPQRRPR
jgi:hypothetical protein